MRSNSESLTPDTESRKRTKISSSSCSQLLRPQSRSTSPELVSACTNPTSWPRSWALTTCKKGFNSILSGRKVPSFHLSSKTREFLKVFLKFRTPAPLNSLFPKTTNYQLRIRIRANSRNLPVLTF